MPCGLHQVILTSLPLPFLGSRGAFDCTFGMPYAESDRGDVSSWALLGSIMGTRELRAMTNCWGSTDSGQSGMGMSESWDATSSGRGRGTELIEPERVVGGAEERSMGIMNGSVAPMVEPVDIEVPAAAAAGGGGGHPEARSGAKSAKILFHHSPPLLLLLGDLPGFLALSLRAEEDRPSSTGH